MLLAIIVSIKHKEEAGLHTFDLAVLNLIRTHKSLQGTLILEEFNWMSVTSITRLSWH